MISALLLAALAATPEQLAEAAPAAAATLEGCMDGGCAKVDGARAAWILALNTYVTEGEADGVLSATVQALDPALFEELPPVLQQAATSPMLWVNHAPSPPPERPPIPAYTPDPRLPQSQLSVTALDPGRRPVPLAVVRFPHEDERHRVNSESGTWTGSVLFMPDGTERFFQKGDTIQFEVSAPGYELTRVMFMLGKRKRNAVTVLLTPWSPTLPADAPPVAHRALASWKTWSEAETAYLASPSDQTADRAQATRKAAAAAARDWLDAGGGAHALQLCLDSGSRLLCGPGPGTALPPSDPPR